MYFPTSIHTADYGKVLQEMEMGKNKHLGLSALIAVGTCEGRALVYKVTKDGEDCSVICKSKVGMVFGKVSGINLTDNGQVMMLASSSGELMSYDMRECIKATADE